MNTMAKLLGFMAVLAVAFGAAVAVGSALGPEAERDVTGDEHGASGGHGEPGSAHGAATGDGPAAHPVRGLAVAENGLRLVVDDPELRRRATERLRFRVVSDASGATVRDFDVSHDKRMHLILARRDLTGFQHLHPEQQADGSWAADVRLPDAGSYRLFADFSHADEASTLAADLRVDGAADLRALPAPATRADAGDGYEVTLEAPDVTAGEEAELRFTVRRGGATVHVEPYLGADGHLVALREGDLAFLHVHPTDHGETAGHDDAVGFEATFPTVGRYRLFLQFRHAGRVHTAAYTLEVR
jgi:hypothetical protein